ncbi:aptB [Symbiodinium natans]|uniref:AptB protein n=1 Tax=Symbiodinium natans TaxID=878477 RepID=A0A812I341_9DINO|nr:aptB [Symbiodinium natans]
MDANTAIGAAVAAGGFAGYAAKGSVPSLVAGGTSGLALIACGQTGRFKAAAAICAMLMMIMGMRLVKTKKAMPAGLVAALSAAGCNSSIALEVQPCAVPVPPALPEVARLSDRVIRILGRNPSSFTLTGTNLYLVGTGSSRILVDAGEGKPGVLQDLLKTMAEQGCHNISQIVVTHWHIDHLLGVPELLACFGSEVQVRKYMPSEGTSTGELDNAEGEWSPTEFLQGAWTAGMSGVCYGRNWSLPAILA